MSTSALRIDPVQFQLLTAAAGDEFLARMCKHAADHFPGPTGHLNPDQLENFVSSILADGHKRGLTTARELCRYLNLRVALASQPADSPGAPWIDAIWNDRRIPTPGARLDRILERFHHGIEVAESNSATRRKFEEQAP